MRLTNFIRQAFVRAVMADVPKTDYQEQAHAYARKIVQAEFEKAFPDIPYADVAKIGWFDSGSISLPYGITNIHVNAMKGGYSMLENMPKVWDKLKEFVVLKKAEDARINTLQTRLEGVANSCSTRKQLAEALPEFEKYLPAEEGPAMRSLPVVTNVISDFVKAGWPKQNAGKIAAAKAAA